MPSLNELRDGPAAGIDLIALKRSRALVSEVQTRLGQAGLLDPPADGDFGPVSEWAWRQYCALRGQADWGRLTARLARQLLSEDASSVYPLNASGADLASRALRSMQSLGYWIARHPDCVNLVYLEGINGDGSSNDNAVDRYNDLRCVISVREGRPVLLGAWAATTQPGWHWIQRPPEDVRDPVKAAAHIALGQYKAWCVGTHHGSTEHEALVQRAVIRVHRDRDRNGRRDGDPVFERADYGINQHHGNGSSTVGAYSAGCLVASSVAGHREFLRLAKTDARFLASNSYRFMTAIIGVNQLAG